MNTVVCIGGGRIGTEAARAGRMRGDRVLVVDMDAACVASSLADIVAPGPDCVLDAAPGEVQLFVGEGAATLDDIMARWVPDMVVPAARGHFAALLAVHHCQERGQRLEPLVTADLVGALPPSSVVLSDDRYGMVVTSYMRPGGTCPDDCDQPVICPVTGSRSAVPMHRSIKEALERTVDRSFVLESTGTGNYGSVSGSDLRSMLTNLDTIEDGVTIGVATACQCHGIMNIFRMSSAGR